MWKKLDKYSVRTMMYPGCTIATEPDNLDDHYCFKEIYLGYVLAISKRDKLILKIFHRQHLETGEWFIQMYD